MVVEKKREWRVENIVGLDSVKIININTGRDQTVRFSGNKPKRGATGQIVGGRFNVA